MRISDWSSDVCSSDLLLSLINDVLDLSKIEAGAYELHEGEVDLAALAGRAVRQVEAEARRVGISVTVAGTDGLPRLRADQRAVFQIYLNLLSNAVKYSGSGGRVTAFAGLQPDGGVAFGVRDTGIGMHGEEIEKAMQRFGQVENVMTRERQGTGLGLPPGIGRASCRGRVGQYVSISVVAGSIKKKTR